MFQRQQLTYGQTSQVVELPYPPEWREGVPSSGTYAVYESTDHLDNDAQLSGSVTTDAVATTFDASAGFSQASNRQRCPLTATTDIAVGRFYLATTSQSVRELVKVKSIASADYVDNATWLANDFVATNTFKGLRQYFTIDATFIATEANINRQDNPWRVLWTYTLNSLTYKTWTEFDVVRVDKQYALNAHDLYELWPDLSLEEWATQRSMTFEPQIDAAWERLMFDFAKESITLDQVRDHNAQDELHRQCVRWVLAEAGIRPPDFDAASWADRMERRYREDLASLKARILLDKGTAGAATQKGSQQPTFIR